MITDHQKGMLLLFITPLLFSTNILVAKFAIGVVPPFSLAFFRWSMASLILILIYRKDIWAQKKHLQKEWPHFLMLGFSGMLICGGFVYKAAQTTSGTNIGIIYALSPVIIILFSHIFLKERMSKRQYGGVALSFIGVFVIISRADIDMLKSLQFTVGDLWTLAACISWAIYSLKMVSFKSNTSAMVKFAFIILVGSLLLLPFTIGEHFFYTVKYSLQFFLLITIVAIVPSLIAFRCYALCQEFLGAGKASLILYLGPIANALLVYLFLGETVKTFHLIGGAVVLLGVFLTNQRTRK